MTGQRPSRRSGLATAALLALSCTLAAGCGDDATTGLACPLLAPGALSLLPEGAPLAVGATATEVSSIASPGGLVAHPLWLAAGEKVEVAARFQGDGVLIAYGPRNRFGGYAHCSAIARGGSVSVTFDADADGEYLVLAGGAPDVTKTAATLDYVVSSRCTGGCSARADRCPTLAERGCGAVRCDGVLVEEGGCATCTCDAQALCGPDRVAGPNGACVLPGCDCAGVPSEPVCGADGNTWDSPCAAACAGVPVAPAGESGACGVTCPALDACETPCNGLRAIGDDGCPGCDCRPAFAADTASCAACPLELAPVCGSDGVTWPNRCRARCAGAKVLYAGACTAGCTTAPAGCTLDCAFGLRPLAGGGHCLACACADVPATCDPAEGPVCATLPGPIGETTVGSGCLALALGASAGDWGPCGARCDAETPCPEGASCADAGFLAGRCLVDSAPCGCSRVLDPVCGDDGATWDNDCVARCAGVAVAHRGACCEAPPSCDDGLAVDVRGCPATCGAVAADCATNAAFAPSCDRDGAALDGSTCAAHAAGTDASPEYCP